MSGLGIGVAQWWLLRDLVAEQHRVDTGDRRCLGARMDRDDSRSAWTPMTAGRCPGLSGAATITAALGRRPVGPRSIRCARPLVRVSIEVAAGVLLIVAPLWFNTTFALLGKRFDYPDILRRPDG